jgi:hypothetical protein
MSRTVILTLVLTLCCASAAKGIHITDEGLTELKSMFDTQHVEAILLESNQQLNLRLAGLDSSQSIWLKQLWLRRLAQVTHPSASQQRWLAQQTSSEEVLSTRNPEHPQQSLRVVDIARQAKTTGLHWQINQAVEQLQAAWEGNNWDWQSLFSKQDLVSRRAFQQWLQGAGEQQAQQVAEQYLIVAEHGSTTSNELLANVAVAAKSPALLALLWQQTADQHSYQALAKLPSLLADYQAVEQLALALKNTDIQSQALYSLASRYSSHKQAQALLIAALQQSDSKWQAVAVLSKVRDQAFAERLATKFSQEVPWSFNRLVQQNLQQAKVGAAKQ